jgi:hypothetical protein
LSLQKAVGASAVPWKNKAADQGQVAYLYNSATSNAPSEAFATRTGFLQSTLDTTVTPIDVKDVAHAFGILGQGAGANPMNT